MANHNFNFKHTPSDEEYGAMLEHQISLLESFQLRETSEDKVLSMAKKNTDNWFSALKHIDEIANTLDIPEEFTDVWLICQHNDNDFASHFDNANNKLAKEFVNCLKDSIRSVAFEIHHGLFDEDLSDTVASKVYRELERNYKAFTDEEHYKSTMRYSCALGSAIQDCNNRGFKTTFDNTLEYFDNIKAKVFINRKNEALSYLTSIKFDNHVDEVTEDNFHEMWWNGDVSIVHIKNGEISTNFYDENLVY